MAGTAESLLRPLISKKNGAEELGVSGSWGSSRRHGLGGEEAVFTLQAFGAGCSGEPHIPFYVTSYYLAV